MTPSGDFDTYTLPDVEGSNWDTSRLMTDGVLSLIGPGVANRDGAVDVSDLGILATNYGTGSAAASSQAVPEPGSIALLLDGRGDLPGPAADKAVGFPGASRTHLRDYKTTNDGICRIFGRRRSFVIPTFVIHSSFGFP
ncbi:MAG: hypothetical protein U9N87_00700 [Planctomycetota bacterium]|nr:hypothetical protein [Planctomycetota bacterium]